MTIIFSIKGVYEKVTLGNFSTDGSTYHLTDSVTVTEQNGGSLDTMIRWYLTNIEDTELSTAWYICRACGPLYRNTFLFPRTIL